MISKAGSNCAANSAVWRRLIPNEWATTHRFAALIGELFPGSPASKEFAAGVEKFIRIDTAAGEKRGRIDSYYGNAVIEFERSLKATGVRAESQLREYVSGVWAKEAKPPRPLVAIASDGLRWRTYRPTLLSGAGVKPKAEEVELEPLRELVLTEKTLADFWLWLTSLLFRPERTEPSAEQFKVDFGAASPAFRDAIEALRRAWEMTRGASELRLAFETWQKYLTVTYGRLSGSGENGQSEDLPFAEIETLFLKHTYLASVARLLVWASLSKGKTTDALRDVAAEVLSGRFFESRGLANLVENDFFQWVRRPKIDTKLAPVWERIIDQILTYDLDHLGEDVLKGVYQELVDPKDRHDLGEYYTPDWLCERIASELLPKSGFARVLDPACGSGSFLRAAISHFVHGNPDGSDASRLAQVLDSVVGIDVHPLAVTISRATYLLALGFVMPRSVLSADQHTNLRTRSYKGRFRLTAYWDLLDVEPLFRVPCCVLFARRGEAGSVNDTLAVKEWAGKLPAKDLPWAVAKERLSEKAATGRVIFLGDRTALSTVRGSVHPTASSAYAGCFRQGATIVPRNFYFVRVKELDGAPDPDRLYWAETDPEQAEDAKPPYKEIHLSGHVEGRFIYCTALSKHLVPFAMLEPATVVLPLSPEGDGLKLCSAEALRHAGFRGFAAWMRKAELVWNEKRERKADRQSVYDWLDYQGKMTNQKLGARYMVVYNAAGTNLAAASVDRQSLSRIL